MPRTVTITVPKPVTPHTTTHHIATHATHVARTPPPNPLSYAFKFFGAINPVTIIVAVIGFMIALVLIVLYMKSSRMLPSVTHVLIIDDNRGTIEEQKAIKLTDRVYVISGEQPSFLIMHPKARVYKATSGKRSVDVVLGFREGMVIYPISGRTIYDMFMVENADEGAINLDKESVLDALTDLYNYAAEALGSIKVTPNVKINFAIKPVRLLQKLIEENIEGASSVMQRFFSAMRSHEMLERVANILTRYAEQRSRIIIYAVVFALVMAIAIAIVASVLR